MNTENGPEKKFRAGCVSATVWSNKVKKNGSEIEMKSVSIERSYKDKNDQWKSTNTFGASDIPKALLVLSKAYEYLASGSNETNNDTDE